MKSRHEFADKMQWPLVNFVKTVAIRTPEMSTLRIFFQNIYILFLTITDLDHSMHMHMQA